MLTYVRTCRSACSFLSRSLLSPWLYLLAARLFPVLRTGVLSLQIREQRVIEGSWSRIASVISPSSELVRNSLCPSSTSLCSTNVLPMPGWPTRSRSSEDCTNQSNSRSRPIAVEHMRGRKDRGRHDNAAGFPEIPSSCFSQRLLCNNSSAMASRV